MENNRSIHGLSSCVLKMLKIMKLTVFLMLISFFGVFASETYSQTTKLSLKVEKISLEDFLIKIEDQSEFRFFYTGKINVEKKVSGEFKNKKITEILDDIKEEAGIQYEVMGRQIILSPMNTEIAIKSIQQQKSISGTVTDEASEPLPGVTILRKGSTQGTVTNVDGSYSISNIPEDATLIFSFVGMTTQEITVGNQTIIDVTMAIDAIGIEEVVAIGYGVVKKSDLTGSVGSMKAQEISKQPISRIDQALQGRIAGVQVSTLSGAPGSGASIRIRGGNSINAGNEPLYVIDGFIGAGDLNTINPNDIATVEVLKDASATAIYGSRGSNGVILITTKRGDGKKGFGVSYDGYVGVQSPVKKLDILNGPEYAEFRNEFAEFAGNSIPFPDLDKVSNTDWQDILFRTAIMTNHNLNFYNSTDNSNYYVSLNYLNQDGIQLGSGYDRYQLRFNFDQKLGKVFKIGASLNAAYSIRENPRAAALTSYVIPTAPVYNEDGSFFSVDQINGATYNNPIAQDELISDNTYRSRALGNIYMQFTPINNVIFKSTFGFDFNILKRNRYESGELPTSFESGKGGVAIIDTEFPHSIQNENTINYTKQIGDHNLSLLGGWTYQQYDIENLNVSSSGFSNDVATYNAIETGDPAQLKAFSGESNWSLLSGLYRLNYSYKGKYLLTASGRHDGSSRLAEGNKWAFFPSAAFAWRVSEEPFIKEIETISNLKMRASYGQTGSQSIAPYATLARLNSGINYFGGEQVVIFIPASSASPDLKWENTTQFDLGIDVGLFHNKLNVTLDYYKKKTTDLLLARELPFQTGFNSRLENVGSLQNAGVELNIDGQIINKKHFLWTSNLTISSNKSEVLELSGGKEFFENGLGSRLIVGEPIGTFFGAKFIGLWQEGDPDLGTHSPGTPKFEDLNSDGLINVEDGQILGNGTPDFFGGINNILNYKNFTLSVFLDFSYGNEIYDLDGRAFNTGHATLVYGKFRDRWTPANTDTEVPRAGGTYDSNYYTAYSSGEGGFGGSDFVMSDGSYLRLKNINLQYDLPINNNLFKKLSFYGSATNLLTFTKYKGFSPDINSDGSSPTRRGFDSNSYPPARIILFGIKADF